MLQNGIFSGELITECLIMDANGQGLKSLNTSLMLGAVRDVEVHEGPVAELYRELPGFRFDVTEKMGKGGDALVVRQTIHVATDEHTRLYYATNSASITASGFAGYLRKMDTLLEVIPADAHGSYKLKLSSGIAIARPWYAPHGIFKSKAEAITLSKFQEAREMLIPKLVGAL